MSIPKAADEYVRKPRRRTAEWLAFLLGGLGVHKFYLGQFWQGILYLLLVLTGISLFLSVIDFIRYLTMTDAAFEAKYFPGGTVKRGGLWWQIPLTLAGVICGFILLLALFPTITAALTAPRLKRR